VLPGHNYGNSGGSLNPLIGRLRTRPKLPMIFGAFFSVHEPDFHARPWVAAACRSAAQ